MTINLLNHTLEVMADYGKTVNDIEWIGTDNVYFSWEEFAKLADTELNNTTFGLVDLPSDLKIVGDNWWMELDTDPSQVGFQVEWAYREKPVRPKDLAVDLREQADNLMSEEADDEIKIVLGDDEKEHNEVVFFEPNETYEETD